MSPGPIQMAKARPMWRRHALRIGQVLVAVVLIALVLRLIDVRAAAEMVVSADPLLLAMAAVLALVDRGLMIGKWYLLLRVQVPWVGWWPAVRAYLASSFAVVLPSYGADILRTVLLGQRHKALFEVGASIVTERLLGVLASAVVSAVALAVALQSGLAGRYLAPWIVAVGGLFVLALLVPLSASASPWLSRVLRRHERTPVVRIIDRFALAYAAYRQRPRTLVLVGALSVLEQCVPVVAVWVLALALKSSIGLTMLVVAVPLTVLLDRIPISLSGWGLGEWGMVYLLGFYGVAPVEAVTLSVVGRVLDLVVLVPGALAWLDLSRSQVGAPAPVADPAPLNTRG